ncbi:MAG: nucleotidyl transferase AbiEii/AbiGii toxin family protein [Firmicutes bacterium]|nr:nucleotidyl transferase AbiEii/AbiGii toxin family protein [Bacillota bacterium]
MANEFYLADGTGLALQLKHRRSFDLDFFRRDSEEKIPLRKIDNELKNLFSFTKIDLKQADQATWYIKGIKVAFLAYPFPLLHPLVPGELVSPSLKGIFLAAPEEIALMKAYALGRRTTIRDYLDLYFLLKPGIVSLAEIIADSGRKYIINRENIFSARLFLEQLVYMKDLEYKDILPSLLFSPLAANEMESYFKSLVRRYLNENMDSH